MGQLLKELIDIPALAFKLLSTELQINLITPIKDEIKQTGKS